MRHLKRFALTILLSTAAPLHTSYAADEQQRLQQLRNTINELRQDIGSDKQEQSQQQQNLKRLEQEISSAKRRLHETEQQLGKQRQAQQQLQTQADALSQKLEQQKQLLAQQIRSSYTPTEQQTLKLLLNQSSPADASRILAYYGYFSRAQLEIITATRHNIDALQETNEKLSQSRANLEALKKQQQQEQDELAARKGEQKTLITKLNSKIRGNEQSLNTMLADEQALSKLMQELEAKRARSREKETVEPGKLKGKLQWPLQGKITHSFGEPRNQGRMTWQGVMISAKEGQEISAIAPGKVVFADWMRGYGLLLIIDHGNNLMSLYGHNERLRKGTGDRISSGETIATVGASDNSSDGELYFELRHKGKPVDPEKWLR